jgi:hypothetical protein
MQHFTKQELIAILESSFKPLVCYAKTDNHGNEIVFSIFDDEECLMENIRKRSLDLENGEKMIFEVVERARFELKRRGCNLDE